MRGADLSLSIQAASNLRYVQIYTPPNQDFFCVEPVSHMPDAINRAPDDMQLLAPGEQIDTQILFRLAEAA